MCLLFVKIFVCKKPVKGGGLKFCTGTEVIVLVESMGLCCKFEHNDKLCVGIKLLTGCFIKVDFNDI